MVDRIAQFRRDSLRKIGPKFTEDEEFFRLGFQAAMHARTRCMEFDQVSGEMNAALEDVKRRYPGKNVKNLYPRLSARPRALSTTM